DTEDRLGSVLDRLLIHTRDEKFITSRQCIQNTWKVATTNRTNREKVLKHLEKRFVECADEKHYNLLRQDVIQAVISLDKFDGKDGLLTRIRALIAKEADAKNRKKYEALLQGAA
ncbi:MAG TPA: hypothetical protein VFY83_09975, partial [Anaerolineales bacterium]|nr:hypothetical protein [Anaerolineales bacterium]